MLDYSDTVDGMGRIVYGKRNARGGILGGKGRGKSNEKGKGKSKDKGKDKNREQAIHEAQNRQKTALYALNEAPSPASMQELMPRPRPTVVKTDRSIVKYRKID